MSDQDKPQKSQQSQEILTQTVQVLGVVFSVVITVIKWSFIITMFILGTIFWLLDLWLGDGRNPVEPPWNRRRQRINPKQAKEQIRREIKRKQSKKFLNEYEDMLMQLQQEETERLHPHFSQTDLRSGFRDKKLNFLKNKRYGNSPQRKN